MVVIFNFMKYQSLYLVCLMLFTLACKEPKKTIVYKNPSFDSIGKMSYQRAISLYGKPIEDGVFPLRQYGLAGPRVTLLRTYKSYDNYPDIDVLEAVWRKDSIIDIMIWYKKGNNNWQPIDTIMYEHGIEF
jgi:hypothetical protein